MEGGEVSKGATDISTEQTATTERAEPRATTERTSMQTYAGIDYGRGQTNVDAGTGIRFGVIAQNSVAPEALDDCWMNGEDLTHTAAVQDSRERIAGASDIDELVDTLNDMLMRSSDRLADVLEALTFPLTPESVESVWAEIEDDWNDAYSLGDCGERDWLWEENGYKLTNCLQSDVMVLRSPYFTYAQFCSPCVPGACNLDSPLEEPHASNKCYCLGHDWFDDGRAPYPVYSVETGELVAPEQLS